MSENQLTTEIEEQNSVGAYVRPPVGQHMGIELIANNGKLLKSILAPGVEPDKFDPKRTYRVVSYVPPAETALYWAWHNAPVVLGVSLLQMRKEAAPSKSDVAQDQKSRKRSWINMKGLREKPAKPNGNRPGIKNLEFPQTPNGLLTSCTLLLRPTPWMELLNLDPSILFKVRLNLEQGEPVVARILPPDVQDRDRMFLESRFEFYRTDVNGRRSTLNISQVADASGQDPKNTRLTIVPPDARVRAYMEGMRQRPQFTRGVEAIYEAPPSVLSTYHAEPFRKIVRQPTPAVRRLTDERERAKTNGHADALPAPTSNGGSPPSAASTNGPIPRSRRASRPQASKHPPRYYPN